MAYRKEQDEKREVDGLKYFCDKCNEAREFALEGGVPHIDLCEPCSSKVKEILEKENVAMGKFIRGEISESEYKEYRELLIKDQ